MMEVEWIKANDTDPMANKPVVCLLPGERLVIGYYDGYSGYWMDQETDEKLHDAPVYRCDIPRTPDDDDVPCSGSLNFPPTWDFFTPTGWKCPVCGRGVAPTVDSCPCYAVGVYTTWMDGTWGT